MRCQFLKVWQLHIVAKDMTQMGICIVRHRQLITLEHMCRQRKDLFGKTGIVEGDTHATGNDFQMEDGRCKM